VIGVDCQGVVRKLFQIVPARDGSVYVAFPYLPFDVGRVGFLTMRSGSAETIFGEDAPVTAEKVKYSHHPNGAAHFSQSGRVRTEIRKSSVPFGRLSGHIFTVTFQGIDRYPSMLKTAKPKRRTAVAAFSQIESADAYKFIAHIYSERELASRIIGSGSRLWIRCALPSGKVLWGITLATNFSSEHGRKFIFLMLEPIGRVCAQYDELFMFLGGFDPPEISLDPAQDTRALMLLYPEGDCSAELIKRVGTIDLHSPKRS
jgi:hypothetical protein